MIEDLKTRTYILERTRGFFVGRPDEPYSGAARFEPCLRAAHFEPADSGGCSALDRRLDGGNTLPRPLGADPPAYATAGVGLWLPLATRDT
jgi:hypothetical protein